LLAGAVGGIDRSDYHPARRFINTLLNVALRFNLQLSDSDSSDSLNLLDSAAGAGAGAADAAGPAGSKCIPSCVEEELAKASVDRLAAW